METLIKKQLIPICLALILCLGLFGCTEQSGEDININVNVDEIDTSGWETCKNEKYGFEFKYPSKYEQGDSIYSLWTGTQGAYNLLFNWGVNRAQETIFSIRVYNKEDLNSLLEIYHYEIGDKQGKFGNGTIVYKLFTHYGNREILAHEMLSIGNEYIYFISSSSINVKGNFDTKNEFYGILNSLVID